MTDTPAPGIGAYEHVPSEQYHAWNGVLSKSALWPMVTGVNSDGSLELCPAKLKYDWEHPRESTREMVIGDALDCLLLEPHEFEQRFIMAQSCQAPKKKGSEEVCGAPGKKLVDGEWRCGTHGKGGDEVPSDKTLLDHIEMTQVRAMADSIRSHPVAGSYFSEPHHSQVAMVGTIFGHRFKGRFDMFRHDNGTGVIVDLKTTRNHREHAFRKDAVRLGYPVQSFIYACLAYQNGWIDVDGRVELLAVGKSPIFGIGRDAVYPVEIYTVGDDLLALGERHLEQIIRTFDECDMAGEWPVNRGGAHELTIPEWLEQAEQEAVGHEDQ